MTKKTAQTSDKRPPVYQLARLIQALVRDNTLSPDLGNELNRLVALLAASPTTHREVDHRGPKSLELHALRRTLEGMDVLSFLAAMLHYEQLLLPGEQWTITMASDCGFQARLILQADQLGDCDPNQLAEYKEARDAVLAAFKAAPSDEPIH
jgi:hypothetical protein